MNRFTTKTIVFPSFALSFRYFSKLAIKLQVFLYILKPFPIFRSLSRKGFDILGKIRYLAERLCIKWKEIVF